MADLPRVIWTLWLQGWGNAPETARACLESWRRRNPGWRVEALDEHTLRDWIPEESIASLYATSKQPEALSDQIRVELLYRHGGVWVDATAMCARPLDDWLFGHMQSEFFAFDNPGPDRMLASWFLASAPRAYMIGAWRERVEEYWRGRISRDDYFWFHKLFAIAYSTDARFKQLWNEAPKLPAAHDFHFSPEDERLRRRATDAALSALRNAPPPVLKLTHKLSGQPEPEALIEALHRFGYGGGNAS